MCADRYQFTVGSDVVRDGMFVEVTDTTIPPHGVIAEVFYSDETNSMSLSCFAENIPLGVIEELIQIAHARLVPMDRQS